jgi:hypothetical protein
MTQLIQLNTAVQSYRPISVYVKCILISPVYVFIEAYASHVTFKPGVQKTLRSVSLGRPNFVPWLLILVGPQYGTSYMLTFWRQLS